MPLKRDDRGVMPVGEPAVKDRTIRDESYGGSFAVPTPAGPRLSTGRGWSGPGPQGDHMQHRQRPLLNVVPDPTPGTEDEAWGLIHDAYGKALELLPPDSPDRPIMLRCYRACALAAGRPSELRAVPSP